MSFHAVKQALDRWPAPPSEAVAATDDPLAHRLLSCLRDAGEVPEGVGPADLATLTAQILRRQALHLGDNAFRLRASKRLPWPDRGDLPSFGLSVVQEETEAFWLTAQPWKPAWLSHDNFNSDPTIRGDRRGPEPKRIQADPSVIRDLGIQHYRSPGQAAAIRAASLLPEGETLVVNLPTGSGKSLVFQAVAIRAARRNELTLIVVPTTALAKDQEFRLRELLAQTLPSQSLFDLAYHSGLSSERREDIRRRIRQREQSIVITSPEAVDGGLRIVLERAAKGGWLACCALDEAHMLSQWGGYFRPEFQLLPAHVRHWRNLAPESSRLRTLLLSATLTNDTLDTLRSLFGGPPGNEAVSCVHVLAAPELRAEPEYFLAKAANQAQRTERVVEAIRRLPRPLILYTTERDHARDFYQRLREIGFRRLALFRGGDAATQAGERHLQDWRDGRLDIVVATSAFGLGMDNADVRSVVHACEPESVDRFYQEVGRGGRDGKACLSLWIPTREDYHVAQGLAHEKIIGNDLGWQRWTTMRDSGEVQTDSSRKVGLEPIRPGLNEKTEENYRWNVRTLNLMARAGLVTLSVPTWGGVADEDTGKTEETRLQEALDENFGSLIVRENGEGTKKEWEARTNEVRARTRERIERDRGAVRDLLEGTRPFNCVFAEIYTLELEENRLCKPGARRERCPSTRNEPVLPAIHGQTKLSSTLLARGPEGAIDYVHYPPRPMDRLGLRTWKRDIRNCLKTLVVAKGFVEIVLPDSWRDEFGLRDLSQDSPLGFIALRSREDVHSARMHVKDELPLPRVTCLEESATPEDLQDCRQHRLKRRHVILFAVDLRDPDRPDRSFRDLNNCLGINEVKGNL